MHKQTFRKQIILSSILVAIAIVAIVVFCVCMFKRYSPPNESNTAVMNGIVTEVYFTSPKHTAEIAMLDGESLVLASPYGLGNLYSTIGYDIEELADLLEGKNVEYRRLNDLPWAVEIYMNDTKIDNTKLTTHQIYTTWVAIIIVVLIVLVLIVLGDVEYLKTKYHIYQKAERKRMKKDEREAKLKAKGL